MKKKRKQTFSILFLLVVLSFLLLLNDTLGSEKDKRIYNISIITTGKNSEGLMIMKQGIDQAASEMNVDISFVTLSEDNNVVEQTELIAREINNKADAIIISPIDYEKLSEPIENAIYHGMEFMGGDGEILVKTYIKENDLYIDVIDNGLGMLQEIADTLLTSESKIEKKSSGIGLKNVNERIQLYFGKNYGVEIYSEPDEGTTISIHMPGVDFYEMKKKGELR